MMTGHRTAADDFRRDLLFGEGSIGFPIAGKIRGGIMRLVRPPKDADQAAIKAYKADLEVYDRMVAEQKPWDEIEKAVNPWYFTDENAKTRKIKRKLTPQNVDYFTLRPCDCNKLNPENAKVIHDLYDEDVEENGVKVKRLVRIPILLVSNDWFQCIPHSLEYRKANTMVCHSEYTEEEVNGRIKYKRVCVAPVERERGKRAWGGREWQELRNCDPGTCEDYQEDRCKMSGYIYGIIPGVGIKGAGVWQIHSRSFYSFRQMAQKLLMVGKITNGRIESLRDRETGEAALWVFKAPDEEITMWDKRKGEIKRREQDLIYIDTSMEMEKLYKQNTVEALRGYGRRAEAILGGRPVPELAASKAAPPASSLYESGYDFSGDEGNIIDVPTETTTAAASHELREDQIESTEYAALPEEERTRRLEEIKAKIKAKRALIAEMEPKRFKEFAENNKVFTTSSLRAFEAYLAGLEALAALPV